MSKGKARRQFNPYDQIKNNIRDHGRSIPCIADNPPFCYTIGNTLVGMPELLIIGMMEGGILNMLSEIMIEAGKPFDDGQLVLIPGARLPVKVIKANDTAHTKYARLATGLYGNTDYPILQIVMCDKEGKFADEVGCKPPYCTFPVLRVKEDA